MLSSSYHFSVTMKVQNTINTIAAHSATETVYPSRVTWHHDDLAAILLLDQPPTESIVFPAYLRDTGKGTYFKWLIERHKHFYPQVPLFIPSYNPSMYSLLTTQVNSTGCHIIKLISGNQLELIAGVASQTKAKHIACFTPGFALAPEDFLGKFFHHHLLLKSNYTFTDEAPKGVSLEIIDKVFLSFLSQTTPFNKATNLSNASNLLIAGTNDTHSLSFFLRQMIRLVKLLGLKIISGKVKLASSYGVKIYELPEFIDLISDDDVNLINQAITKICPRIEIIAETRILKELKQLRIIAIEKVRNDYYKSLGSTKAEIKKKHPRVLYITNPSGFSGAEESLCQLVENLDRDKFEAHALIGTEGFLAKRLRQAQVSVRCKILDNIDTLNSFLFFLSLYKEINPDIIHFNAYPGLPAIYAAKNYSIPIIQHLRIANLDRYKEALSSADVIIAISDFVRQEALRYDLNPSKIFTVYNSVNCTRFDPKIFDKIQMRRSLGLPVNAQIALVIARYAPNKRHDLVIQAVRIALKRLANLHLVFVGESMGYERQFENIYQQAKSLIAREAITFLGFQEDVRKVLAASDVLVLYSDREPLGRCLLEAMSMEVPVICNNSGGSHEIIKDGITGEVLLPNNAMLLANRLTNILTDRSYARSLAEGGRKYVQEELESSLHAKRIMEIYAKLISK